MKRIFALMLAGLLMLSLCACTNSSNGTDPSQSGGNTKKDVITSELQGVWHGPYNQPTLNINADGTGTVKLNDETCDATFTAENDVFTVTSEIYYLSGNYTLDGEKLTVKFSFDGKEYTLIFTRTPIELPEDSYIYNYDDETYEINFTDGKVIVCEFPPSDDPPTIEVFYEIISETIIHVHPRPPVLKDETTASKPSVSGGFPYPEEIDISEKDQPQITIDGEPATGYISNNDITGTWTTMQDTTVSFFGVTNYTTTPITYTFNSDGTGTILAMGIIPGTMTYSVENGVFNLTVSMLGQTESGTGYIKRAGDKLYIMNVKKEIEILTKQG